MIEKGSRVKCLLPEFTEFYGSDRVYIVKNIKEDKNGKPLYVVHFEGYSSMPAFQFHEENLQLIK